MTLDIIYKAIQSNNDSNVYTLQFECTGYSMKNHKGNEYQLKRKECVIGLYNGKTLKERVEELKKEFSDEWYNELMLYIFKDISSSDGRLSALKSIMDDGYILGFYYDLMGCAEIIRINKKSLTILDICDNKHYISYDYFNNELETSQFYVTNEY